jgi:DNA-binding transcriptional MerR regulator
MTDPDALMTIREMCTEYGVTPRTLRFYEARELLAPHRVGQKRLFTRRDRARLKLILRGKRFGFSLEEIRELLELYDRDDTRLTQLRRTFDIARERLADMERQRDELDEAIADLKSELDWGAGVLARAEGASSDTP